MTDLETAQEAPNVSEPQGDDGAPQQQPQSTAANVNNHATREESLSGLQQPKALIVTPAASFDRAEDITTDEGKQQASKGETPLSLYLSQMGEMQMSAMERILGSTVDAPCSTSSQQQAATTESKADPETSTATERFVSTNSAAVAADAADDACHPIAGCQQTIEDQLEVLTKCRQPLELFPFLSNVAYHTRNESGSAATVPLGMYTVPCSCEYCGSSSTQTCRPDCQRPKLYFQKKKPPFASNEKNWDPVTEYEIMEQPAEPKPRMAVVDVDRRPSWVAGLFGSSMQTVDSTATTEVPRTLV